MSMEEIGSGYKLKQKTHFTLCQHRFIFRSLSLNIRKKMEGILGLQRSFTSLEFETKILKCSLEQVFLMQLQLPVRWLFRWLYYLVEFSQNCLDHSCCPSYCISITLSDSDDQSLMIWQLCNFEGHSSVCKDCENLYSMIFNII